MAKGWSATVRAETDVEFLVISRGDYNRILGAVTEEQLAEKIKFLHALPPFAGVPASMLRSAAYVLLIQVSDEMSEFDGPSGELFYEKAISFLRALFRRWKALGVSHSLSVTRAHTRAASDTLLYGNDYF